MTRIRAALTAVRGPGCNVGGLACLTTAAALLHPVAGFATAGVSLLLLGWLSEPARPKGGAR